MSTFDPTTGASQELGRWSNSGRDHGGRLLVQLVGYSVLVAIDAVADALGDALAIGRGGDQLGIRCSASGPSTRCREW